MSLRKSPRVTPAMLAANRANAKKSTGPRTSAGKARVRLNPLKRGNRCPSYQRFVKALSCSSERVDRLVATMLRPYEMDHPLFAALIESWVSIVGAHGVRWIPGRDREGCEEGYEQSRNLLYNQ